MQTIMTSTKGIAVLLGVQKDRIVGLATVAAAMLAGAWLCSLGLN